MPQLTLTALQTARRGRADSRTSRRAPYRAGAPGSGGRSTATHAAHGQSARRRASIAPLLRAGRSADGSTARCSDDHQHRACQIWSHTDVSEKPGARRPTKARRATASGASSTGTRDRGAPIEEASGSCQRAAASSRHTAPVHIPGPVIMRPHGASDPRARRRLQRAYLSHALASAAPRARPQVSIRA